MHRGPSRCCRARSRAGSTASAPSGSRVRSPSGACPAATSTASSRTSTPTRRSASPSGRRCRRSFPPTSSRATASIALVKPNYWVKGGTLTMQVFEMRHVGLGDLLERLERLRQTLKAEGLFEADRKKPLPFLPGVHRARHRQGLRRREGRAPQRAAALAGGRLPRRARRRPGRPGRGRGHGRHPEARRRPRGGGHHRRARWRRLPEPAGLQRRDARAHRGRLRAPRS